MGALEKLLTLKAAKSGAKVNFRRLGGKISAANAHYLHPYPGKLLPQIPAFLLSDNSLCAEGGTVLDPFCGAGTVLLETVLSGRIAVGSDSNPLARLISTVKATPIVEGAAIAAAAIAVSKARRRKCLREPIHSRLEYWYEQRILEDLGRLRDAIDETPKNEVRRFLQVCFSAVARKVSLTNPRLSVPVKLNADKFASGHRFHAETKELLKRLSETDCFFEFLRIVSASELKQTVAFARLGKTARPLIGTDARSVGKLLKTRGLVDLILTSPPYVGAQKYVRASSLSLLWLGYGNETGLSQYEAASIGREGFVKIDVANIVPLGLTEADKKIDRIRKKNPLRAKIASSYLHEMSAAFDASVSVLKKGGKFVLVSGENHVAGEVFPTPKYLDAILVGLGLIRLGLFTDEIRSRVLMTRRKNQAKIITREWVHVYEKPF